MIISKLGIPSLKFIESCHRASFRQNLRDVYFSQNNDAEHTSLEKIFECNQISKDSLNLLKSLLVIDPSLRISAGEALKDSYFKPFHDLEKKENHTIVQSEIVFNEPDFAFEMNGEMTIHDFRHEMLKEINYHAKFSKMSQLAPYFSNRNNKKSPQSVTPTSNTISDDKYDHSTKAEKVSSSLRTSSYTRTSQTYEKKYRRPSTAPAVKQNSKSWLSWSW